MIKVYSRNRKWKWEWNGVDFSVASDHEVVDKTFHHFLLQLFVVHQFYELFDCFGLWHNCYKKHEGTDYTEKHQV